jgi:hypothetical protein
VDPGVERAQEVADRAVAVVDVAGGGAVGQQHDAGEVAAVVARAHGARAPCGSSVASPVGGVRATPSRDAGDTTSENV